MSTEKNPVQNRAIPAVLCAILFFVMTPCSLCAQRIALPAVDQLPDRPELPSPLITFHGDAVKTPQQWNKRREELKQLFQHYVYGYLPPSPTYHQILATRKASVLDGKAKLIEIDYRVGPDTKRNVTLHLAIVCPVKLEAPVPVIFGLNKCGNFTILSDQQITKHEQPWLHSGCKKATRGEQTDYWCVEKLIDRGYAFATCQVADIDPDKNDFSDGVHPLYTDWFEAQKIAPEHRWGTIAAWAWGIHRCVDCLTRMKEIDAKKIAVFGHSRRGKTALFSAAMDERIALVIPHQSGTGGMALSRNNDQETVERITRVFPHWFCGAFSRFAEKEQKLPVDQHLLVCLIAPRPLIETSGLLDTWANYPSSFRGLQKASLLYEWVGSTGLKLNRPLTSADPINRNTAGRLLQYRLNTKHVMTSQYWEAVLDFSDLNFEKTQ